MRPCLGPIQLLSKYKGVKDTLSFLSALMTLSKLRAGFRRRPLSQGHGDAKRQDYNLLFLYQLSLTRCSAPFVYR